MLAEWLYNWSINSFSIFLYKCIKLKRPQRCISFSTTIIPIKCFSELQRAWWFGSFDFKLRSFQFPSMKVWKPVKFVMGAAVKPWRWWPILNILKETCVLEKWWQVLERDSTESVLGNLFQGDNRGVESWAASLAVTPERQARRDEWCWARRVLSSRSRGITYFLPLGSSIC